MSSRGGRQVDGWTLLKRLGRGGHADVWRASRAESAPIALKILRGINPHSSTYRRFREEVAVHRQLERFAGILPLIDASVPAEPTRTKPAWLAMPEATLINEALGSAPRLETVVGAIRTVAQTLGVLAAEGIHHRDIKPANLYCLDSTWLIGDFGLADFPEKEQLTRPGEKLGPVGFLAPEMLMSPDTADAGPADVYSLAKALWVLACHERWPPQGEILLTDESLRLSSRLSPPRARLLDGLLNQATKSRPDLRPTMDEFAEELGRWLRPAAAVRELTTLDEIAERIRRIEEPHQAVAEDTRTRMRAANDVLEKMKTHLSAINTALPQYGLSAGIYNASEVLFSELGLASETSAYRVGWEVRQFADQQRTDGRGPLEFIGAVGVEDLGNGYLRLTAAYAIGENHLGRRPVWEYAESVLPTTAGEESVVTNIGNGLADQLRPALATFAARLEARYPPPILRDNCAAVVGSDGLVYVLGGQYQFAGGALATVEAYEPISGTWIDRGRMPTARMQLGAATYEGRIFAVGGHTHAGHLATVEIFDPSTDRWDTRAQLDEPRSETACVAGTDGRIYAIGGYGGAFGHATNRVMAYDPEADRWELAGHLPAPRRGHAAVATIDGKIYVIGGGDLPGGGPPLGVVDQYDVNSGVWRSDATPMPTPRAFLAAALHEDGRIYVAGGHNEALGGELDVIEAYDPSSDTWTECDPMDAPRSSFAAVGCSGRVLVVGGRVPETEIAETIIPPS